jgi:hypothetical protein
VATKRLSFFMRISLPERYHSWLYTLSLMCLAAGLPQSKFLLSLSIFIMAGNWLWEGDFAAKWNRLKTNKAAWVFIAFFLLHVIGLVWTDNALFPAYKRAELSDPMGEAFRDLRVKLPLFLLPFMMGTSRRLGALQYRIVITVFISAVTLGTIITILRAGGFIGSKPLDLRKASEAVALIRLSLMCVLSIFFMGYFATRKNRSQLQRVGLILLSLWFVLFMVYMQSLTGIAVLLLTGFIIGCVYAFRSRKRSIILSLLGLVIAGLAITGWYSNYIYTDYYRLRETKTAVAIFTAENNPYEHYEKEYMLENGHYVMRNICWTELQRDWPKRSKKELFKENVKDDQLAYVLLRYMSSKGLRKDAAGLAQLNDADIKAIEQGVTNYRLGELPGIGRRIYQVIWETDSYLHTGDPSDRSIPMRLAFWSTSWNLIKTNPLIGTGTGDMPRTYYNYYATIDSPLDEEWRTLHAHNQFLTITVQFGVIGLVLFLLVVVYPGIQQNKFRDYFFFVFFLITTISFLNEDTLETQQGVTFFSFFAMLLLFARPEAVAPGNDQQQAGT